MYNHICTQFTTFSFILIKAKKPFSFDFNNKKRKRKRKREKACSCLFPIFFFHFFLSIIISNLLKHMKRRQNIEVHTYRNYYIPALYTKNIHHHQKMIHDMTQCVGASTSPKF